MDIKYICMVQKKYTLTIQRILSHSAENLKLFCCKWLVEMGYVESDLWANLMREWSVKIPSALTLRELLHFIVTKINRTIG